MTGYVQAGVINLFYKTGGKAAARITGMLRK